MGAIAREKKKGDGKWYVFINHRGRRRAVKCNSKTEATQKARIANEQIKQGKLGILQDTTPPFSEYCQKWIEKFAPKNCKASTLKDYQAIVRNHLQPSRLWNVPVTEISKPMVEDFLVAKLGSLRPSTVKHIKTVTAQSLDRAVGQHGIVTNAALQARLPGRKRKSRQKVKPNAYNSTEVAQLLDTFKVHAPQYWLLVLFMARTGLRTSEVAALTWKDIDLDNKTVRVCKGFVRGTLVESTKSETDRVVKLSSQLVGELRKAKLASDTDLVFTNKAGNHVDFNLFRRRVYNKMVAKAKLKPSRLHDLRHTFASILLSRSRDIKLVQKQLGHSKASLTLDVYSHWLEEDTPTDSMDLLDDNPQLFATKTRKGASLGG